MTAPVRIRLGELINHFGELRGAMLRAVITTHKPPFEEYSDWFMIIGEWKGRVIITNKTGIESMHGVTMNEQDKNLLCEITYEIPDRR